MFNTHAAEFSDSNIQYTHTPRLVGVFPLQVVLEKLKALVFLGWYRPGHSGKVDSWVFWRIQLYCRITHTHTRGLKVNSSQGQESEFYPVHSLLQPGLKTMFRVWAEELHLTATDHVSMSRN